MAKGAKWITVAVMTILAMMANQFIFIIMDLHNGVSDFLMAFVCMIFNGWVIMDICDVIKEK